MHAERCPVCNGKGVVYGVKEWVIVPDQDEACPSPTKWEVQNIYDGNAYRKEAKVTRDIDNEIGDHIEEMMLREGKMNNPYKPSIVDEASGVKVPSELHKAYVAGKTQANKMCFNQGKKQGMRVVVEFISRKFHLIPKSSTAIIEATEPDEWKEQLKVWGVNDENASPTDN